MILLERRRRDRRGCSRGGRRATDVNPRSQALPACPGCGLVGVAREVETAEDGWWFVCGECDQFWNERERCHAFVERCAMRAGNVVRSPEAVSTTISMSACLEPRRVTRIS